MRICLDLDGVIAQLREEGETYEAVEPVPGAVERIRSLRAAGHEIVIMTARHMKTCEQNVGKVIARKGKVTLDWLERYGIEYDEIWFGKPHCDVYIDDNAIRFHTWDEIEASGANLPEPTEGTTARGMKG